MAKRQGRPRRQRGAIDELPSGALRVRVYGGIDPVTKRRLDLSEIVPPGPKAAKQAEQARTRLLNQVDENRSPRSRATMGQLVDRWFAVHDGDPSTLRGYETKIRNHVKPVLGNLPLTRVTTEILDSFYADLRRCRAHCDRREHLDHRTTVPHDCDEHDGEPCRPPVPETCKPCRRACKPHVCRGLAASSIRQIHWIVSGALDRGVVWGWIATNPAEHATKPTLPHPDPKPPSAEEAARLVDAATELDADWGAFVWTKMTIGARRGEMCALRWHHLDLVKAMLTIRRSVYLDENNVVQDKDTKTHQQRRVVLDPETVVVLEEVQARARQRAEQIGETLRADAYVFSTVPDGASPLLPGTATHRYKRMARKLSVETSLKNLRHYSATELISAGVDVRTVAGRLGHGGGGATTLRVYTAWSSEADQRAAGTVSGRMPPRKPQEHTAPATKRLRQLDQAEDDTTAPPYLRIAADLRAAIRSGVLSAGDELPTEQDLARRYDVVASTAHRAIARLAEAGLVEVSRGKRAVVARPN